MDKLLQNELFTRLLALALAILVYVQVTGQNGGAVQRTVNSVPVQVADVPQGLTVAQWSPRTVQVTVSGSRSSINALQSSSIQATVSLANAHTGSGQYYINVGNLPLGVQSVKTTPQDATVVVEPQETLNVAVQVDVTGLAASGFAAGTPQIQANGKLVVLIGPANAIAQVVRTVATVNVQSARTDVVTQVAPVPLDKNGQSVSGIQVAPSEIKVTVPVGPVPAQPATVVPKVAGTPAAGYSVTGASANPATVTIYGAGNLPISVPSVTTGALSVAGASATVQGAEPVILPQGATGSQPASVQVTARIARSG